MARSCTSSALAQSSSRTSNPASVASSPGRASTDLMISCTRPRRNRPAEARNTRDANQCLRHSGWYLAANAPNPNRPSSALGAFTFERLAQNYGTASCNVASTSYGGVRSIETERGIVGKRTGRLDRCWRNE